MSDINLVFQAIIHAAAAQGMGKVIFPSVSLSML